MVLGIFSKYLWSQIISSISYLILPIAIFKKNRKTVKNNLRFKQHQNIMQLSYGALSAAFLFIQNELRFVH
jgi:predicted permease